ncbi:multicopper oxidase family protein [Planosporangium sp. 12N6]|uniref:multicopper oxidase family protein n=1 Tax=Planosporangium spinosum TaxID=3402278 RepID=UPI003CE94D13
MLRRRHLLIAGTVGAAALLVPHDTRRASADIPASTPLDPTTIPKYVTALAIPAVMPPVDGSATRPVDRYVIGVRQFRQRILPPRLPATTVWGYGVHGRPDTYRYPSFTIEATVDRPVGVTWVNDLVDARGRYLPHLVPVDPTLHWANPPGGTAGRDSMPTFTETPGPYTGPVPFVTHLHGAHTSDDSDGYPEAWYLPKATNIPAGYATVGSYYERFRDQFAARHGAQWEPGTATFQYPNHQQATALWFHDHTLGMTRANIYAGPAGFYLLRGGSSDLPPGVLPGPAPALGDPPGTRYHEIPLLIQDRSFNTDGSMFYPNNRVAPNGSPVPVIPHSDVPPMWNPGFFGRTMTVNGRTWPVLAVEPRRYRLRLLNACDSRFLLLKIAATPDETRPARAALPIWQIGGDGGFLPAPVRLERLVLAPAERADIIVDFTGLSERTALYLINEGADGPSRRGEPTPLADPATTGQVMKFVVRPLVGADTSVPPDRLELPAFTPLGAATVTRRLAMKDFLKDGLGPIKHQLGTVDAAGNPVPMGWHDPVTEKPEVGATEIWEFHNSNRDAHPIHIHAVQFQVVGRGPDGTRPPDPGEEGFKDTVIAYPNELTRVKGRFELPGRYVWHCHMASHEDNDMMRPYQVGPDGGDHGGHGVTPAGQGVTRTGDGGTAGTGPTPAVAGAGALAAAAVGGAVLARRRAAGGPRSAGWTGSDPATVSEGGRA